MGSGIADFKKHAQLVTKYFIIFFAFFVNVYFSKLFYCQWSENVSIIAVTWVDPIIQKFIKLWLLWEK